MQILPLPTRLIEAGDDLAIIFLEKMSFKDGDVLVVSSKAIATSENTAIELSELKPSKEAIGWAKKSGLEPHFAEAVVEETKRMHGRIAGAAPGALLTYVKPAGLKLGMILAPNAGLDKSNIEKGYAIGWPLDPLKSARQLKRELEEETHKRIAVIVSDSCCRPARRGVTAFALTVAGMNPLVSEIGKPDLFGNRMRVTFEATADQLATAANTVMGNSSQRTPAAIIRGHGFGLSTFAGWVPGIEPEEDLFSAIL